MNVAKNTISIEFGDVRKKSLNTPNHFVSHMVEHIAWRLGLSINVGWQDENWRQLGTELGSCISRLSKSSSSGKALGMIDDGSAEVEVVAGSPRVTVKGTEGVDINWFLGLRCEQLDSGKPLMELLEGLSDGLQASTSVVVWNVEDTHHTWEGVFRGVGIALSQIYSPVVELEKAAAAVNADLMREEFNGNAEIQVLERGMHRASVRRGTAETGITVTVDLMNRQANEITIDVDSSIGGAVCDCGAILERFLGGLGASAKIDFKATKLSSSHVVMEDIGLVMGRALLEILKVRMDRHGVNGAGSSLCSDNARPPSVEVGISVEGRKFWRIVPRDGDLRRAKSELIIGGNVMQGLRTEDLDDFLDGLSGGMSASIMVHVRDYSNVDQTWQEIFSGLGAALRMSFAVNPFRRGVPPGVKATLA